MDTASKDGAEGQASWILLCEAGHEWPVVTAGEDPPPSRCPQCNLVAADYKSAPTLEVRQPHNMGRTRCKCRHCSPEDVDPEHELYWQRQRGSVEARHCACGLRWTLAEFRKLELVGYQPERGYPYKLEMRNCTCGSTIAIEVDKHGNVAPPE